MNVRQRFTYIGLTTILAGLAVYAWLHWSSPVSCLRGKAITAMLFEVESPGVIQGTFSYLDARPPLRAEVEVTTSSGTNVVRADSNGRFKGMIGTLDVEEIVIRCDDLEERWRKRGGYMGLHLAIVVDDGKPGLSGAGK